MLCGVMNEPLPTPASLPTEAPATNAGQSNQNAEMAQALAALLPAIAPLFAQALAAAPGGKPGYKTTEFWLTVVGVGFNIWGAINGAFAPWVALTVSAILTIIYNVLRSAVKTSAASGAAAQTLSAVSPTQSEKGAAVSLFPAVPAPLSSGLNGAQGEPATVSDSTHETQPGETAK